MRDAISIGTFPAFSIQIKINTTSGRARARWASVFLARERNRTSSRDGLERVSILKQSPLILFAKRSPFKVAGDEIIFGRGKTKAVESTKKIEGSLPILTAVGFEPTQLALVELESTPLDHSGKLSLTKSRFTYFGVIQRNVG